MVASCPELKDLVAEFLLELCIAFGKGRICLFRYVHGLERQNCWSLAVDGLLGCLVSAVDRS